MGQIIIRSGSSYTFSYCGSAPVTWIVDVINAESDQIYLHQVGNGKTLQMSLEHFREIYDRHGVREVPHVNT
ncbi:hypothetical protein [Paenibacillus sp. GM2]|uniref:hypothetical protein n=1 Tax=Paenibacillus sp. GM2 TaxID=1622070 RepID=UPI00083888D5|nr:hypothetical protein [Paenibacillus sp. GM2]